MTHPKIRVLIADDDPEMRTALHDALARVPDFEIIAVAEDTQGAISLGNQTQPDVALLDMKMPGGGGVRAAQELSVCAPETRIVGLSAFDDSATESEFFLAGGVAYLVKGVPIGDVVDATRKASETSVAAPEKIRVLVVDDETAIREAVVDLLEASDRIEVVGTAAEGAAALKALAATRTDVVLMDLRMPQMDGIEATTRIVMAGIATNVLIHSAYEDESLVLEALQAGARGYVVKGSAVTVLVDALAAVASGRSHISDEVTRPLIDRLVKALAVERTTRIAADTLAARQRAFAMHAAHELRTPLTAMIGCLELLVDGGLDPSVTAPLTEAALESAHRLRRLAENLEITANGDAVPYQLESVHVESAIDDVIRTLRHTGETVRCDVAHDLHMWTDKKRFQQIVDNLLRNAVAVSPKGTEVVVGAHRTGDSIAIDVSDAGPGFPQEMLTSMLLEPFAVREEAVQGMGVGVYVVGELARNLDASIASMNDEVGGAAIHLVFNGASR